MKGIIIAFSIVFFLNGNALSQDNQKPKVWIGIWDYTLKYQGAYQADSILFINIIYHEMVKTIYEKIKSNNIWHYVLVASDSMEIVKTSALMQQINITDYEYKWRFAYNGYMSYLKDSEYPPKPEFLLDGHWLYFSTEKNKVGVSVEKHVKNHQLDKFSKYYDLETGLENDYFEVENGLLNGIHYFDMGKNRIKAINRYKEGVLIESLYNRND